jgi:hypothetical protein
MYALIGSVLYSGSWRLCGAGLCFAIVIIVQTSIALAQFETPATYSAASLLDSKLLKGASFEVQDEVKSDGMFYHFTVDSPFGTFEAYSMTALRQLVHEIEVIDAMKQVATDDAAIESLKQSGKNAVAGVRNLVEKPQETLEGAAAGVGSLFNRAAGTVGKRKTTDAEDNRAQQIIGFSKSKGAIATHYGVNVYSGNQVLQEELDRLAWADYLGGLGVGAVATTVPGLGGVVLATSGTARLLNEVINTTPAAELWLQNKNKLLAMGAQEDTVELFLNNRVFTPALTTVMVAALEQMESVENRELFITIGLQASDTRMARVITSTAVMSAGYHLHVGPLSRVTRLARISKVHTKDDTTVIVLPTDHLIWSEQVATIAQELSEETQNGIQLFTLGDLSTTAKENLNELGWRVHTDAGTVLMPSRQ